MYLKSHQVRHPTEVLLGRLRKVKLQKQDKKYEEYGAGGYWTPTKENAIRPLYQLLAFAQMRPDGIWAGD